MRWVSESVAWAEMAGDAMNGGAGAGGSADASATVAGQLSEIGSRAEMEELQRRLEARIAVLVGGH